MRRVRMEGKKRSEERKKGACKRNNIKYKWNGSAMGNAVNQLVLVIIRDIGKGYACTFPVKKGAPVVTEVPLHVTDVDRGAGI